MTANRRSVRKRRSKHKGSMKIITLIVLVLCGVFGVFTWQNTQKSEQYALVQENLQQQIDDEEENQKAIEEQAEYQKTDAYIEDLARDKELHFIVIGVLGMALLFVIFPLFKALSRHHVLVIAWIYVFTVMIVVTFAIEIGQGITNTGKMEMEDIVSGLAGFMFLFIIFAVLRAIVLGIVHLVRGIMGRDDDDDDDDDE